MVHKIKTAVMVHAGNDPRSHACRGVVLWETLGWEVGKRANEEWSGELERKVFPTINSLIHFAVKSM